MDDINFRDITSVAVKEAAEETDHIIMESAGKMVRLPASNFKGGGARVSIIKMPDQPEFSALNTASEKTKGVQPLASSSVAGLPIDESQIYNIEDLTVEQFAELYFGGVVLLTENYATFYNVGEADFHSSYVYVYSNYNDVTIPVDAGVDE